VAQVAVYSEITI